MACLPLIERELRVALRKQRPAQGRLKIAALATGGSMLFLWFGALTHDRGAGRSLEQLLCVAGLYFVLRAPMLTAGVLAEERRNQTLGLLFLSGLGSWEVFASKFLSAALIAFTNLLAIFPMLALPFLIGGISYDLFLAIICELPVLMLLALAVSLLASVLARDDGTAVVLAHVLGVLLCGLTPAIYLAQTQFSPLAKPSLWWLRLSPTYSPYLIWHGFRSGFRAFERAEFWHNLILTLGWSALGLIGAAFALKRVWREREEEEGIGGWRERWRRFVHGGRESRQRLGRLWLDQNPFIWLAGRDRQPATLGWLVVGGIVVLWLLCWEAWPSQWPSGPNLFATATLLDFVLLWLTRHTAAQQTGLARRDGAYELLLTTALSPGDIVWGELESLRWHFQPLANFVLCLDLLMMLGGLAERQWNAGALVVFFIFWLSLLIWTWSLGRRMSHVLPVMWASLNCGRPAHALLRTSGFKGWWLWIWFWNLYNFRNLGKEFQGFPSGSPFQVVLVVSSALLFLTVWLVKRHFPDHGQVDEFKWDSQAKVWRSMRSPFKAGRLHGKRLINEFREIVREPLPDPSDPRFKEWNVFERFPWRQGLSMRELLAPPKS